MANMNDNEQEEFVEHNLNDKEEERQVFHETLEALGAKDLYDDEETIMGLWMKLRETDPSLLRQFEQFIGKVTEEMKRSKLDHRSIEAALQSKSTVYDDEIKKLYEEMEQQIHFEKAKVLQEVNQFFIFSPKTKFFFFSYQEKLKERELREQMEHELLVKEQQLAEVTKKQNDLEIKLIHINLNETETKNDNERLLKVFYKRKMFVKLRIYF
jgi:hypothetical protein